MHAVGYVDDPKVYNGKVVVLYKGTLIHRCLKCKRVLKVGEPQFKHGLVGVWCNISCLSSASDDVLERLLNDFRNGDATPMEEVVEKLEKAEKKRLDDLQKWRERLLAKKKAKVKHDEPDAE